MAGQEYRPITCYRRVCGNQTLIAGGFFTHRGERTIDVPPLLYPRDIMAQPLTWLMLIAIAMGMLLDVV